MMKKLFMALVVSLPFAAAAENDREENDSLPVEEPALQRKWFSAGAFADVKTAYIARGKVIDSNPYSAQCASGSFLLGDFGRVGAYAWSVSSLTGSGQSGRKRYAYNEVDYNLFYSIGFELDEGWTLKNGVARQWVTLPGYPGANTICEWQARQALENPYATPYWLLRRSMRPEQWNYWCVGLMRSFDLTENLAFRVDFYGDLGDSRHLMSQYGKMPGKPTSSYRGGLQALNLVLRLDYSVTEYLSVYAFVWQFDVVSSDARSSLDASLAKQSRTDMTVGGVGVAVAF